MSVPRLPPIVRKVGAGSDHGSYGGGGQSPGGSLASWAFGGNSRASSIHGDLAAWDELPGGGAAGTGVLADPLVRGVANLEDFGFEDREGGGKMDALMEYEEEEEESVDLVVGPGVGSGPKAVEYCGDEVLGCRGRNLATRLCVTCARLSGGRMRAGFMCEGCFGRVHPWHREPHEWMWVDQKPEPPRVRKLTRASRATAVARRLLDVTRASRAALKETRVSDLDERRAGAMQADKLLAETLDLLATLRSPERLREIAAARLVQAQWRRNRARRRFLIMLRAQWRKKLDERTGRFYYIHRQTGRVQWHAPRVPGSDQELDNISGWSRKRAEDMTRVEAAKMIQAMFRRRVARREFREMLRKVWRRARDKNNGRVYYFNRVTRQTQWERPKLLKLLDPEGEKRARAAEDRANAVGRAAVLIQSAARRWKAKIAARDMLRSRWDKVWDASLGAYYYWDRATGESRWTEPLLAARLAVGIHATEGPDAVDGSPSAHSVGDHSMGDFGHDVPPDGISPASAPLTPASEALVSAITRVQRCWRRFVARNAARREARSVWERVWSDVDKRYFWYDAAAGTSQWDTPRLVRRLFGTGDNFGKGVSSADSAAGHLGARVPPRADRVHTVLSEARAAVMVQSAYRMFKGRQRAKRKAMRRFVRAHDDKWDLDYYFDSVTGTASWVPPLLLQPHQVPLAQVTPDGTLVAPAMDPDSDEEQEMAQGGDDDDQVLSGGGDDEKILSGGGDDEKILSGGGDGGVDGDAVEDKEEGKENPENSQHVSNQSTPDATPNEPQSVENLDVERRKLRSRGSQSSFSSRMSSAHDSLGPPPDAALLSARTGSRLSSGRVSEGMVSPDAPRVFTFGGLELAPVATGEDEDGEHVEEGGEVEDGEKSESRQSSRQSEEIYIKEESVASPHRSERSVRSGASRDDGYTKPSTPQRSIADRREWHARRDTALLSPRTITGMHGREIAAFLASNLHGMTLVEENEEAGEDGGEESGKRTAVSGMAARSEREKGWTAFSGQAANLIAARGVRGAWRELEVEYGASAGTAARRAGRLVERAERAVWEARTRGGGAVLEGPLAFVGGLEQPRSAAEQEVTGALLHDGSRTGSRSGSRLVSLAPDAPENAPLFSPDDGESKPRVRAAADDEKALRANRSILRRARALRQAAKEHDERVRAAPSELAGSQGRPSMRTEDNLDERESDKASLGHALSAAEAIPPRYAGDDVQVYHDHDDPDGEERPTTAERRGDDAGSVGSREDEIDPAADAAAAIAAARVFYRHAGAGAKPAARRAAKEQKRLRDPALNLLPKRIY